MKTKFVEYKKGEPWSCGKCCHLPAVTKEGVSCAANGWLCAAGTRKDGRNGYFVEVKEKKEGKMSKKVDLSKCKIGDEVVTREGCKGVLVEKRIEGLYPYAVRFGNSIQRYMKSGTFLVGTKGGNDIDSVIPKTQPKPTAKKPAVVPAPQKKPTIADVVGKFIAIEAFGTSDEFNVKESDILGIFDTEKQAIGHICEDAKESFEADNEATIRDGEDWASNFLIVEIKRVVRPVITATVTCEAKEVE